MNDVQCGKLFLLFTKIFKINLWKKSETIL